MCNIGKSALSHAKPYGNAWYAINFEADKGKLKRRGTSRFCLGKKLKVFIEESLAKLWAG